MPCVTLILSQIPIIIYKMNDMMTADKIFAYNIGSNLFKFREVFHPNNTLSLCV
jgi:hypothetical protein